MKAPRVKKERVLKGKKEKQPRAKVVRPRKQFLVLRPNGSLSNEDAGVAVQPGNSKTRVWNAMRASLSAKGSSAVLFARLPDGGIILGVEKQSLGQLLDDELARFPAISYTKQNLEMLLAFCRQSIVAKDSDALGVEMNHFFVALNGLFNSEKQRVDNHSSPERAALVNFYMATREAIFHHPTVPRTAPEGIARLRVLISYLEQKLHSLPHDFEV